jgi:hypothetical protein
MLGKLEDMRNELCKEKLHKMDWQTVLLNVYCENIQTLVMQVLPKGSTMTFKEVGCTIEFGLIFHISSGNYKSNNKRMNLKLGLSNAFSIALIYKFMSAETY